jgi:hypothetical protein
MREPPPRASAGAPSGARPHSWGSDEAGTVDQVDSLDLNRHGAPLNVYVSRPQSEKFAEAEPTKARHQCQRLKLGLYRLGQRQDDLGGDKGPFVRALDAAAPHTARVDGDSSVIDSRGKKSFALAGMPWQLGAGSPSALSGSASSVHARPARPKVAPGETRGGHSGRAGSGTVPGSEARAVGHQPFVLQPTTPRHSRRTGLRPDQGRKECLGAPKPQLDDERSRLLSLYETNVLYPCHPPANGLPNAIHRENFVFFEPMPRCSLPPATVGRLFKERPTHDVPCNYWVK